LDQAASKLSSECNKSPHGKLLLEDKGASVTLHWRQAPLAEPFARQLLEEISQQYGLELRWGKSCGELMPKDSPDKGRALTELAQGTQVLIYAGDDLGDLAAFHAMDEMSSRLSATCKIAVDSPEAPAELLAEADLIVDGPVGLKGVLDTLRKTRCPQQ
jgi:trehalose 6-phosphate phosphatase